MTSLQRYHSANLPELMKIISKNGIGMDDYLNRFFNDYEREFLRTFDEHYKEVINNFIKGKSPPIHAKAGKRALELALASIKSFKLKKVINI